MKIQLNDNVREDLKTLGVTAKRLLGRSIDGIRQRLDPSNQFTRSLKTEYDRLRAVGKSEKQSLEAVVAMTRAALKEAIEAEKEAQKPAPQPQNPSENEGDI